MGAPLVEPTHGRWSFARLKSSTLCRRDVSLASAWDVIGWWESRRVPFNLIVGSAGILSCIIVGIVAAGASILFDSDFGLPNGLALIVILLYGIMANICFAGGWLTELLVRRLWPRETDRFATVSFSLGLVFSVLLTLTPAIVIGAVGIFGLLEHLVGARHG